MKILHPLELMELGPEIRIFAGNYFFLKAL